MGRYTEKMKKKWIMVLGILICCSTVLVAVNWKDTISKFRMFHTEKLILVNQSIDEISELIKGSVWLTEEAGDEDIRPEYSSSWFVMTI